MWDFFEIWDFFILALGAAMLIGCLIIEHLTNRKSLMSAHHYFGDIHYVFPPFYSTDRSGCWITEKILTPPINNIEIYIDAGKEGPSDNQVSFCKWVEENIHSLVLSFRKILEIEYKKYTKNSLPQDVWSVMKCDALAIPERGIKEKDWFISFTTKNADKHSFNVIFRNGAPISVETES